LSLPRFATGPGYTDSCVLSQLLRAIDGYTGREVIGIALKLALLFLCGRGIRKARLGGNLICGPAQWRIPANA